ncbi:hypothetical protein FI667_g14016, partial [Globisporangium splendens]
MCLCFCSGDPVEGDVRKDFSNDFAIGMMDAPAADPLCCLGSCFCPCCAQIYIRRKALHGDMTRYTCCQGYMDGIVPCFKSGQCGESTFPNLCLCMESFCCNGCAVSSTRMLVMDRHNLRSDKWDNRIIRCNNCIQLLSVICSCLSICIPEMNDCADAMSCIAQCTYAATQGCMTAQINVELNKREYFDAPVNEAMERV